MSDHRSPDKMPAQDPLTPKSSSSPSSSSSDPSSSPTENENLLPPRVPTSSTTSRKRPGQTKSRTGCYSCKRRKVKCNEQWPECDNCKRLKLDCVYPWAKKMAASEQAVQPSTPLRTTPAALTLEDLRFYHFFMTTCYPRWPADPVAQRIWGQAAAMSGNVSDVFESPRYGLYQNLHLKLSDESNIIKT